jgi:hypothetical protein
MSGRVLLDTNIVIALFAKEASIQQQLADADEVFIPSGPGHKFCKKLGTSYNAVTRTTYP